jgi:hypothetical protein
MFAWPSSFSSKGLRSGSRCRGRGGCCRRRCSRSRLGCDGSGSSAVGLIGCWGRRNRCHCGRCRRFRAGSRSLTGSPSRRNRSRGKTSWRSYGLGGRVDVVDLAHLVLGAVGWIAARLGDGPRLARTGGCGGRHGGGCRMGRVIVGFAGHRLRSEQFRRERRWVAARARTRDQDRAD